MKKVFLLSLIMVLLGALIVPTIAAPVPAEAAGTTVACSPADLHFRVYAGVPTYLLGFIPLDDGQKVTLTLSGSGISGWTVSDDAGWLNENLLFGVLSSISSTTRNQDVTVRVNTNGLAAGTYTATITFKFTTCGTKTITVPVTVDVIEPKVMGPLGIGADKDLLKNVFGDAIIEEENEYSGLVVNLLTNPDDAMDMQAIETDGSFNLMIQCGDEIPGLGTAISGGSLTINGETKQIADTGEGFIAPLGFLVSMTGGALPTPADFDWGENYAAIFPTTDNIYYIGIVLGDIGALLDLPLEEMLGGMISGEETEITGLPAPTSKDSKSGDPNELSPEMVIPLKPILNLLSPLMPVMFDLLGNETVLSILQPLIALLPPIIIVMPMDVMMELVSGLM